MLGYNLQQHCRDQVRGSGYKQLPTVRPGMFSMTDKCEEAGFLNPTAADNLGQLILCCGGLSRALGMFNSIPGLSTLDARRTPHPGHDNKNIAGHCPVSSREAGVWGKIHPRLRTTVLKKIW